jgi:GntR family transcriptional regulator/MocR family aminotransferase
VSSPDASLPSTRQLAELLKVHRKTVVAAYDELYAQGWTVTIPRKGIEVSNHLPELKPLPFKSTAAVSGYGSDTGFKFSGSSVLAVKTMDAGGHKLIINDGFPDPRIAPVDELVKAYRSLFHQPAIQRLMTFGNQQGSLSLRKSLVKFLTDSRALTLTEENILVTRGAQMAIYMAARLILKPGSTVLVGEPNYFMANMTFEQCGAKLIRVPVDKNGIDVEAIEKICKKKKPDLIYIVPHHHHPTTVTLSAQRRMSLLHLIRANNIAVIEDDYDYDFHYTSSPILPLASADHGGNVIYIGSVTKTLAPSLRFGYMVAPKRFITEGIALRRLIDIRSDNVWEEALATLFDSGQMQNHLKRSVKLYHQRRDKFCELLKEQLSDKISFEVPDGGMAVWVKFNKKYSLPAVSAKASREGLYLSDGTFYNSEGVNYNSVRMGFASLNDKEITEVVKILTKIM